MKKPFDNVACYSSPVNYKKAIVAIPRRRIFFARMIDCSRQRWTGAPGLDHIIVPIHDRELSLLGSIAPIQQLPDTAGIAHLTEFFHGSPNYVSELEFHDRQHLIDQILNCANQRNPT